MGGSEESFKIFAKNKGDFQLTPCKSDTLDVIGYVDGDFGGCTANMKSTSGYIFCVSWRCYFWKSIKQSIRASSTVQEFIACREGISRVNLLTNFILGLEMTSSILRLSYILIMCDCFLLKKQEKSPNSKHAVLFCCSGKEKSWSSNDEQINTEDMIADPLTKALPVKGL